MRFDKLKRLVDPTRPITYGIVQAGPEFEGGIPYIRPADMTNETGVKDFGSIKHTSPEIAQQYRRSAVKTGDLVISIGPSFGKVMEVPSELDGANLTQGTARVAPGPNLHKRFAFWCLRSQHCYSQWEAGIGGATFRALNLGPLAETRIPNPDLPTQRAIADFLDRETARIDLLIEKKQRLVALLGEKAKAKKLDFVTGQRRGEQKETRILWAPSIPQHWEERAVWMLFELGRGRVMSHEYIAENEGEYPIYSSQTTNDGVMGYINTYDFEGDYLTWTTDGAKAGTVFRRHGKFNCTNVCGTLRPLTRSIDLNYAQVALDTATDFFVRHDINPKLMNGVMSKIRFPYPPLDEQRKVGAAIEQIEKSYKPILEKNQTSIDRLKEYRSALITAAVTGQIAVSTYAKSGATDRRLDAIQEEMGA